MHRIVISLLILIFSGGRAADRLSAQQPASVGFGLTKLPTFQPANRVGNNRPTLPDNPVHPVFLPRFSPEQLPFFCRIEHKWALKTSIPVKFRLGSVEYVDWLEGKIETPPF